MIRTAAYLLAAVVGAAMPLSTTTVHAQSFNCEGGRNLTIIEELICRNPRIADLDGQLGIAFNDALTVAPDKVALREQQRQWLRTKRDKCTDSDCLWRAYETRTRELIIESRKYLPLRPIQVTGEFGWPLHGTDTVKFFTDSGEEFDVEEKALELPIRYCRESGVKCAIKATGQGHWITVVTTAQAVANPKLASSAPQATNGSAPAAKGASAPAPSVPAANPGAPPTAPSGKSAASVVAAAPVAASASPPDRIDPRSRQLFKALTQTENFRHQPGKYELELVAGDLLYECKVGGKYLSQFGYLKMRNTFTLGRPTPNEEPFTLFISVIDYGDGARTSVQLLDTGAARILWRMEYQGCAVPSDVKARVKAMVPPPAGAK